jgi:hypothetical protein
MLGGDKDETVERLRFALAYLVSSTSCRKYPCCLILHF